MRLAATLLFALLVTGAQGDPLGLTLIRTIPLNKRSGQVNGVVITRGGLIVLRDANFREETAQAIEIYDSGGRFLRRIGRFGRGPGEYFRLFDIGVDSKGIIWAADKSRVTRFDASNRILSEKLIQNPGYAVNGLVLDESGAHST